MKSTSLNRRAAFVAQNSLNRFQGIRLKQNPALQSELNLPSTYFVFFQSFFFILNAFAPHIIPDSVSTINNKTYNVAGEFFCLTLT